MRSLPAFCDYDRRKVGDMYGSQNVSAVELIFDSYMHLLASSPFDQRKPIKLFRRFASRLLLDLRTTIALFSSLADSLLESIEYTSEDTKTGVFLEDMKKTPIFREYLLFYQTGDAAVLQFVLSFLVFAKKTYMDFRDLETSAFRDWLGIEKEMSSLAFDTSELRLLKVVSRFLVSDDSFDDSLLLPKHGSGQVSERADSIAQKFDFLGVDAKLKRCFGSGRFGTSHYQRSDLLTQTDMPKWSRFVLRPKSYKSYRFVCIEPAAYMFFQQEVMRWLVDAFDRSRLHEIVDLSSQALNQQYALAGSSHFSLDTIDLSAASDRVHLDLVRGMFSPKVLFYLLGSRSSRVKLPDGSLHTLRKFAAMGSATCFPVQCVVFSTITITAYLMQRYSCTLGELGQRIDEVPSMLRELFKHMSRDFETYGPRLIMPRVYGDDIVCDSRVTHRVTSLLEHFGLKVNAAKSFTGGQCVRESCGIYAYNGYDITPLLFRIKTEDDRLSSPSFYASLISAINRAGDFGYRSLQSYLIRYCRRRYTRYLQYSDLPFVESREEFGIWTKAKHAPRFVREMPNVKDRPYWQIQEERVLRIGVGKMSKLSEDMYLYDQWMRSKLHDVSKADRFKSAPSGVFPRHMRLSAGWTPLRM